MYTHTYAWAGAYFVLEFLLGPVLSLCFPFELFDLCHLLLPHFGQCWVRNMEKWKLFQHQGQQTVFTYFHRRCLAWLQATTTFWTWSCSFSGVNLLDLTPFRSSFRKGLSVWLFLRGRWKGQRKERGLQTYTIISDNTLTEQLTTNHLLNLGFLSPNKPAFLSFSHHSPIP